MSWWQRLKATVGLGLTERAPPRTRGAIIAPTPLGWQAQRIGGNLTPQQVSSILREADTGYVARLIDLENEARQRDCHLQSILATREQAVAGLPFEVTEPAHAKARDKRAAVWVKERLDAVDDFPTLLSHLVTASYHSFSVAETIWGKDDGDVVPSCFSAVAPRRFVFEQQTQCLHWWDQAGGQPYPGVNLAVTYPGKFITHQPRINGDVPAREGLGRVLMWSALFRNWDIRDWLSLAEIAWKPWRTGKYQKGASLEDIDALETALERMSTSGVAVLPETTEALVHWPTGAGSRSTHGELAAFLGAEMSKAVLGATTTVEQGDRGALALGKVHNEIRKDIREADARSLAATLRRDLIAPMVRMNFGPSVRVPVLRFLTEDSIDLKAYAEAVALLQGAGLRIPVAHVYDVSGIPEPQGDEECLEAPDVEVDTSELEDAEPEEPPPADDDAEEVEAA